MTAGADLAPAAVRHALMRAWHQHPTSAALDAQLAAARARLTAAGQPIYNPEAEFAVEDEGTDRTSTGGLKLTFDWHDKRGAREDAAHARLAQAEAQARLTRRDFVRQWVAGWADVQTVRQRVATGERRLQFVTRFAEIARKQFAAQDISGLERDLAQLALDEALVQQSTLVADLAEAEARFRALGGVPDQLAAIALPTDSLPEPGAPAGDIAGLPELQVALAAAAAAEREVTVAQRNRAADPTLGVRVGRIDYGALNDTVAGVSVSIPLFVRNSYRAEVAAAHADATAASADAARMRLQLESDRRRSIDSYAASHAAWTRWVGSGATDMERRTTLLERLLREGELSPSDYLLQLRQTLDTQLAGVELEARVWRTFTDYLATTGQLECWTGLEATR
jgi:cobalt-zinc-cadmium efflux system outer membrane protein